MKAAGIAPNFSPVFAVGGFGTQLSTIRNRTNPARFDDRSRLLASPVKASPAKDCCRSARASGRKVAIAFALYCPKLNRLAAFLVPPFFTPAGVTGNGKKEQW